MCRSSHLPVESQAHMTAPAPPDHLETNAQFRRGPERRRRRRRRERMKDGRRIEESSFQVSLKVISELLFSTLSSKLPRVQPLSWRWVPAEEHGFWRKLLAFCKLHLQFGVFGLLQNRSFGSAAPHAAFRTQTCSSERRLIGSECDVMQ